MFTVIDITVKPEIFTTFLFSRLSRIRKIRENKKSEKFYLFSYLTVKFGVCRAIMGVNITTLNKNDVKYVLMNKQPNYSYPQVANLSLR